MPRIAALDNLSNIHARNTFQMFSRTLTVAGSRSSTKNQCGVFGGAEVQGSKLYRSWLQRREHSSPQKAPSQKALSRATKRFSRRPWAGNSKQLESS